MLTTTPAVRDIKQSRTRALCAASGALAATLAWIVEVPILGVHLNFRFGTGHLQTIAIGQVIGVTVAASLLGWLLLALLERRTPHARRLWTTIALASLAASLALPLAAATTTSAVAALIVMHMTVGAVVIPTMARTARTPRHTHHEAGTARPAHLRHPGSASRGCAADRVGRQQPKHQY